MLLLIRCRSDEEGNSYRHANVVAWATNVVGRVERRLRLVWEFDGAPVEVFVADGQQPCTEREW